MLSPLHLRWSELMLFDFRFKLWRKHRTDVDTQLSKAKRPLLLIPRCPGRCGFERTGRTNSLQPTPLSGRFLGVARRSGGFALRVVSLRSSRGG